jgi:hypothetical protein
MRVGLTAKPGYDTGLSHTNIFEGQALVSLLREPNVCHFLPAFPDEAQPIGGLTETETPTGAPDPG